ncbi:hypothetical protein SpAn4DRAFT_5022 [Sporomusa ovata]|uniref:Uncharacterized protein n=1 Tax=Sporomusa ovata TaxID=2378 RepID=A0A0U1KYW7_9FIRM|nr:hypothetical protein SpAn4DRAFT_5022 [Sporomusa ovata]
MYVQNSILKETPAKSLQILAGVFVSNTSSLNFIYTKCN